MRRQACRGNRTPSLFLTTVAPALSPPTLFGILWWCNPRVLHPQEACACTGKEARARCLRLCCSSLAVTSSHTGREPSLFNSVLRLSYRGVASTNLSAFFNLSISLFSSERRWLTVGRNTSRVPRSSTSSSNLLQRSPTSPSLETAGFHRTMALLFLTWVSQSPLVSVAAD